MLIQIEPVRKRNPRNPNYRRRWAPDRSQSVRRGVQFFFLALNLYVGTVFYFFVRQHELLYPPKWQRPAGVEGWLPIAGLMNFKTALLTGEMPVLHPAAMVLVLTFITMSLLFRKAFCGWFCPVGTLSEYLWKLGQSTFKKTWDPPRWLDIPLRSLKYILLALFLYAVVSMSVDGIRAFLTSPYGIIADVKMLNFFRHLGTTGAVVIGILLIGSIFVKNLWCRFLCPYGALMGLASLASPIYIRRTPEKCIDCAKCAKACPARLPVDTNLTIRSAECLGCLECVAVCPAEGALHMTAAGRKPLDARWMAAGILALFLGVVCWAKLAGHWESPISDETYRRLIPRAVEFDHPR